MSVFYPLRLTHLPLYSVLMLIILSFNLPIEPVISSGRIAIRRPSRPARKHASFCLPSRATRTGLLWAPRTEESAPVAFAALRGACLRGLRSLATALWQCSGAFLLILADS